jgi:hypothetical protein
MNIKDIINRILTSREGVCKSDDNDHRSLQFLTSGIGLVLAVLLLGIVYYPFSSSNMGSLESVSAQSLSSDPVVQEVSSVAAVVPGNDPVSELVEQVNDTIDSVLPAEAVVELSESMRMEDAITSSVVVPSTVMEESISLTDSFEIVIQNVNGRTEVIQSTRSASSQLGTDGSSGTVRDNESGPTSELSQHIDESISLADTPDTMVTIVREKVQVPISADIALQAIRDAEATGADVSELVDKFNVALDQLRQAEESHFDSCVSRDDCIASANRIFESIENEAHKLSDEAKNSLYQRILSSEVYAVVIAFGMSLGLLYVYKHYKSYQLRKFLDMDIVFSGRE